jgi:hypothetical protein
VASTAKLTYAKVCVGRTEVARLLIVAIQLAFPTVNAIKVTVAAIVKSTFALA